MNEYIVFEGRTFVPETPARTVYRAPHDLERVNFNSNPPDFRYIPNVNMALRGQVRASVTLAGKSMPEVFRFKPFHSVRLTAALQWLWKDVNPEIPGSKWGTLLDDTLMLCNGTGFGKEGEPKRDWVNNRNVGCPDPTFDQVRFMGGATLMGAEQDGRLWVDYIPASNPPPAKFVLEHPELWYWATGIRPDGGINYIQRMGLDGTYKRVRIPIIANQPIYIPLAELHRLPPGSKVPEPNWQFR